MIWNPCPYKKFPKQLKSKNNDESGEDLFTVEFSKYGGEELLNQIKSVNWGSMGKGIVFLVNRLPV